MKTLIATLASLTLLCSGCGTIAGHDDQGTMGGVAPGVYRGVRTDWQWIAHSEPEVRLGAPLYCEKVGFTAFWAWARIPSMRPVDPKPAVVYLPKWEDIQTCIITC